MQHCKSLALVFLKWVWPFFDLHLAPDCSLSDHRLQLYLEIKRVPRHFHEEWLLLVVWDVKLF